MKRPYTLGKYSVRDIVLAKNMSIISLWEDLSNAYTEYSYTL